MSIRMVTNQHLWRLVKSWLGWGLAIALAGCANQLNRLEDAVPSDVTELIHRHMKGWIQVDESEPLPDKDRQDKQLELIYQEYLDHANLHNRPVSDVNKERLRVIKFVDEIAHTENTKVAGACHTYQRGDVIWREIEINEARAWAFATERTAIWDPEAATTEDQTATTEDPATPQKKHQQNTKKNMFKFYMIVYHELYHCLHERSHLPDHIDGIMSQVLHNTISIETLADWEQLVAGMFSDEQFNATPLVSSEG